MGIRIHKALGWGLTNVKEGKFRIEDDRLNEEPEEGWFTESQEKFLPFIEWFTKNKDGEVREIISEIDGVPAKHCCPSYGLLRWAKEFSETGKIKDLPHYNNFYHHQSEYGLPHVVQFTPLDYPDWYRFDDTLDYYEAGCIAKSKVLDLTDRCGIYPYTSVIRHTDAPPIPQSAYKNDLIKLAEQHTKLQRIGPSLYNQLVGRWDKKAKPILKGEVLEYMLKWYRPAISDSVLLYTHYLKIFKNWKLTVQELRPMIYTWWA